MSLNLWSSFMCTFALIIGLGLFFKQLDMLLMNEIKAMLTVTFGFAASCLILSFIWILQKRPIDAHHLILSTSVGDIPNLHPDGGSSQRRNTICSISSKLDLPPNYEDALINSKVLDRSDYLHNEKVITNIEDYYHYSQPPPFSTCHNDTLRQSENSSSLSTYNRKASHGVAHLASSIVRGIATLGPSNSNRRSSRIETQPCPYDTNRKVSFCTLDVDQLMISDAPPKFSELIFIGESSRSNSDMINR